MAPVNPPNPDCPAGRIGTWLYGIWAWLVFSLLLFAFGICALLSGTEGRARRLARRFARWMFLLGCIPVSATGLERLPHGPHVLVANHTSFLDPILLSALLPATPGYAFTTRRQYRIQALLWPFVHSVGALVLRPHAESHHSVNLEILTSALVRGENLIVFPEGAFQPEPGLRHFHTGAFVAAAHAGVPVVVVGLRGTRAALPVFSWLPKRRALQLEVGPTLVPQGGDERAVHDLTTTARAAMAPLTGEGLVGE